MNTVQQELWARAAIEWCAWQDMSEEYREKYVAMIRSDLAAMLTREMRQQGYIKFHDSTRDIVSMSMLLSASIRVGYVQRTVWADMPTREMLRELWRRFWRRDDRFRLAR